MASVDIMTAQVSTLCETFRKFLKEREGIDTADVAADILSQVRKKRAEMPVTRGLDLGTNVVAKDELVSFWVNRCKGPTDKKKRDRVLREAIGRGYITMEGSDLTFDDKAWAQTKTVAADVKAAQFKSRREGSKEAFVDRMLQFDASEEEKEREACEQLHFPGCSVHWQGKLVQADGYYITDDVLRRKAMVDVIHGGQLHQGAHLKMTHMTVAKAKNLDATIIKRVSMTQVLVAVKGVTDDMEMPSAGFAVTVQWNGETFARRRAALTELKKNTAALPMSIVYGTLDATTNEPELVRTVPNTLLGDLPAELRANISQGEAIKSALEQRLTLVQGPPGTGKTHMSTGLLYLYITAIKPKLGPDHRATPVLASAPSNCAADEIAHRLDKLGVKNVVRLYAPGRLVPERMYNISLHAKLPRDKKGLVQTDDETVHSILSKASIIITSCTAAADNRLRHFEFPFVLVDESTQCVESETLIPLMHGAHQAVLVGDPKQLSPVVRTPLARKGRYDRSMFERLVEQGERVHCLKTQYRMHPAIARFPNDQFYDGQLQDGVKESDRVKGPQWFYLPNEAMPVMMLDVSGEESKPKHGHSFTNEPEGEAVQQAIQLLKGNGVQGRNIGVVSMYNAQVDFINQLLHDDTIEVGSVDSFQGREKDVIIVSTVRANSAFQVGFVEDAGRLNVAITRPRQLLIIVGHSATLSNGPVWGTLIQHLKRNKCIEPSELWLLKAKTKRCSRQAPDPLEEAAAQEGPGPIAPPTPTTKKAGAAKKKKMTLHAPTTEQCEEMFYPAMQDVPVGQQTEDGTHVTARDLAEAAGGSAAAVWRKQTEHDSAFDFMNPQGTQKIIEYADETRIVHDDDHPVVDSAILQDESFMRFISDSNANAAAAISLPGARTQTPLSDATTAASFQTAPNMTSPAAAEPFPGTAGAVPETFDDNAPRLGGLKKKRLPDPQAQAPVQPHHLQPQAPAFVPAPAGSAGPMTFAPAGDAQPLLSLQPRSNPGADWNNPTAAVPQKATPLQLGTADAYVPRLKGRKKNATSVSLI